MFSGTIDVIVNLEWKEKDPIKHTFNACVVSMVKQFVCFIQSCLIILLLVVPVPKTLWPFRRKDRVLLKDIALKGFLGILCVS